MNKITHPGPWYYKHGRFTPSEMPEFDGYRISVDDPDGSHIMLAIVPESEDNARLISKAPELYQFVRDLHEELRKFGFEGDGQRFAWERTGALISQIEGTK